MKLLYRFFSKEMSGGIILVISAVFAMILANLNVSRDLYLSALNTSVELRIGALGIKKNILLWINDALMTFFFLLVGLEIKRELIQGSLANYQQAILPVIAAFGGMVIPILIYFFFNYQDSITRVGWAIPSATDIAFTFSILLLLGNRVPISLKTFLMALAIVDDLIAIIIVAVFYTNNLSIISLNIAAGTIVILALLNMYNVHRIGLYTLIGTILWIMILKSGIHATLSGIIVSFFIPLKGINGKSPARQLEYVLHPWVTFVILPLFAFANAGISIQDITLNRLALSMLPIGIITGLFIGKPLGISLFCWLAIKLKLSSLPAGITFRQIMLASILCGIGFTMSIFITNLSFDTQDSQLITLAKASILIGSLLSAFVGYTLLSLELPRRSQMTIPPSQSQGGEKGKIQLK